MTATAKAPSASPFAGELQPETASCLPIIRGWLPASTARAAIDDIGKLARRQGLADAFNQNGAEPIVSDIMATTADGVGAQGLTIGGKLQARARKQTASR
ncbi:hypothetical protein [Rhizobium mongolense]|uniref:Uncharacterized protein n=1 Tax=Rhizobium mongolense TaxID=57676 RepID=A0ABR6IY03_9HYPH|nr:hypothetical protein [Rhizobium mongolense]MBB4232690.1 hypothetical protein [Rhizobium mongolense]